jgi:sugar phosphate isomerase/epimerase
MNEMTTYRWSFEEDVRHYVAAGYRAMWVWRQKLSDFGEEKGVELLADAQLGVSSLLWAGGFTGSEGRSFKESVQDASEAIRLAGHMKAACLVVYTGGRGGHTRNHARRLIRSALSELSAIAAEAGVTLALEPMHPGCAAEWTFLTNVADTLEVLDALGSPHVKLVLDTYHLCQGNDNLDPLAQLVPHVALVQMGDAKQPPSGEQNRCRLGEGTVPLGEIVRCLTQAGYDGYYEVELLGEELEADDYASLLSHSRQMFDQWTQHAQK